MPRQQSKNSALPRLCCLLTSEDVQKPESWVDEQRVPDSTAWKPLEWDDEEDGCAGHAIHMRICRGARGIPGWACRLPFVLFAGVHEM